MNMNLYIENHSINCDCWLVSFVNILRTNYKSHNLFCGGIETLKGKPIIELLPEQLLCPLKEAHQCPRGCECHMRGINWTMIVNCTNNNYTIVPELRHSKQYKLNSIELFIEKNYLKELPKNITPGYKNVTKIYAAYNYITQLDASNLPANLTYLDLRFNRLKFITSSALSYISSKSTSLTVFLFNNRWECNCITGELFNISRSQTKLMSFNDMQCDSAGVIKNFSQLEFSDFCLNNNNTTSYRFFIEITIIVIAITASILAIYYKFQQEIKIWLYSCNCFFLCINEEEMDKDKIFDAFISYSHKDEGFVADELVPKLENEPNPFKLCIHERDWMVGEYIPEQIVRSVYESRRTIIVLSKNFAESLWGRMEFRTAYQAALSEKRTRVIVILYGEVDTKQLDLELQAYIKMNTYLKWGDPAFWKKLNYAMSYRKSLNHR